MITCNLSTENVEAIAHAMEFYILNYVWDDLAERDNPAASEEDYRLREIINKLDLKKFFLESTNARF